MRGSKGFSCICVLMDQQFYTFSVIAFYLAMKISQVISLKNIYMTFNIFVAYKITAKYISVKRLSLDSEIAA